MLYFSAVSAFSVFFVFWHLVFYFLVFSLLVLFFAIFLVFSSKQKKLKTKNHGHKISKFTFETF